MALLEFQETLLPLLRVTRVEFCRYFLCSLFCLQLLLIQQALVHNLAFRVVETLGQDLEFSSLHLEFLLTLTQLFLLLNLLNMRLRSRLHLSDIQCLLRLFVHAVSS